jgi:uncharacterized protein YggE
MPVISVRGTAQLPVEPDSAQILLQLTARSEDPAGALSDLEAAVGRAVAALAARGGVQQTAGGRSDLTYFRGQVTLHRPGHWDKEQDREVPGAHVVGSAQLDVQVRDWALLDAVLTVVADGAGAVELGWTSWHVDSDNPGWPHVRAMAVTDAALRARHYAEALGATLGPLEHLADTGLLGGDSRPRDQFAEMQVAAGGTAGGGGGGPGGVPRLDPQPQVLTAEVEARFSAATGEEP